MTASMTDERGPVRTLSDPAPAVPALPAGTTPNTVLVLIAAGAVATIALWWHDTPAIHGLGDWLTNAGRVTGLLAGYGVVVLVALMARIPPLERGVGADRLARWHAHGGRYTVSLVVAHGLLITWGYAITAHTGLVSQTSTLLLSYPDVLMATVAGLLLVGVGLVSARAARRRMRYETWYYLHFYTYLAVALAFSHQFADGADFIDQPAGAGALGGPVRRGGRGDRLVPVRRARPAGAAAPASGGGGVPGGAGSGLGRGHRAAAGRTARRVGPVLPLALPHPGAVVDGQPVLTVGGAAGQRAAHHGQEPRRAQCRAGQVAAGHPGAHRGPVRRPDRSPAQPAQGAADRRRNRHHPAAGAVRVAAGRSCANSP